MIKFWTCLSRSFKHQKSHRRVRLGLEQLERRELLSGNPALTLSIAPRSFNENAGAAAAIGTVTRLNTDDAANLTSSNTTQATVPASVIIPAGQTSTTFNINAVDDHIVTPTQTVTISATANASVPLSSDTSFGGSGSVAQNYITTGTALQADGKVVTAGLDYVGGTSDFYHAAVSRYNADGTLDTSFGTNGTIITDISGQSDRIQAVIVQSDGKIVIGGYAGDGPSFHWELARYNSNGTLDNTFGNGGEVVLNQIGTGNEIWHLAQQSDGKILAFGDGNSSGSFAMTVVRFNSNGSLDSAFGTAGIATAPLDGRGFGGLVQSNGDIVVVGTINGGNYNSEVALARFTSTGALDSSFGNAGVVETDLQGWYDEGSGVAVQPDGKLVVSAYTSPVGTYPPVYDFAVLRYNTNGTLDNTFGTNGITITDLGANDQTASVALQPDGEILVTGSTNTSSTSYSASRAVLARYLPNGTLDGTIDSTATGISGQSLAVASNGEVFVADEGLSYFGGQLAAYQAFVPLSASAQVSVLESDSHGLVAAYNFVQGPAGTVLTDLSGNGNNGTVSNASWTPVSGSLPFTSALQFAGGNNSFVTIANSASLDLTSGMTLEAWVDPTAAANGWQDVMYKYHDNYYLEASSPSGAPSAGGTAGSTDTGPSAKNPLPTNTWSFLAATYNGTNMLLYINGVQVASVAVSGNLATSTAPLQIGGDSTYGQYFQGLISNVRIYNTALTANEIQEDMNTPIAAEPPPTTPANLTATASGPTISLNWGASSDSIGVSYVVEREAPGSSSFVQIATTTVSSYFDNGLAPNSAYTYKVQAVDWAGNQSAFSNTASATTGAGIAGLMAAYNFAQGSGSVLTDASGNGNNGTISNASWTTVNNSSLPFTGALQFSGGNNSYVTIADSPALELNTGMTLEAWVDPTAAAKGWQDVMYKYHDNYYLEAASPSGAPAAGGTAGSTDTGPYGTTPLPINTWSFLAATYNGTNMILYVNGVQVASVAVGGNLATSTNALQIGGDSIYGQYFQGLISNVRIYNKALNQSAIQTDMNTAIG
jgi:uncharacterized delta-60 repeat protein